MANVKKSKISSKSNSSCSCDNFRIIVVDDIELAKSIINSKYYEDFGSIRYINDPISNRILFNGKSFLTKDKSKFCYVCKNIDPLIKNEDVWDDMLSGRFLNGHALVYICNKLDLRTKFAKKFKPVIFSVNPENIDISTIVEESNKLSKARRDMLFYKCNRNVTKFISEFDKLLQYCSSIETDDYNSVFDSLDGCGLFSSSVEDNTFTLCEYIMTQQADKVYEFISNTGKKDFDFGLLTILYNNFRNLYIYGCANKVGRIDKTGLNSFIQSNMRRYLPKYNAREILRILRFLRTLDYSIKSGSVVSDLSIEYMLCGVLLCEN